MISISTLNTEWRTLTDNPKALAIHYGTSKSQKCCSFTREKFLRNRQCCTLQFCLCSLNVKTPFLSSHDCGLEKSAGFRKIVPRLHPSSVSIPARKEKDFARTSPQRSPAQNRANFNPCIKERAPGTGLIAHSIARLVLTFRVLAPPIWEKIHKNSDKFIGRLFFEQVFHCIAGTKPTPPYLTPSFAP